MNAFWLCCHFLKKDSAKCRNVRPLTIYLCFIFCYHQIPVAHSHARMEGSVYPVHLGHHSNAVAFRTTWASFAKLVVSMRRDWGGGG